MGYAYALKCKAIALMLLFSISAIASLNIGICPRYSKGLGTGDWVKSLFVSKFHHLLMS
ncbi:hypothetical protein [Nostoc sp. DedVER01b]|nr:MULTISPECIES: hypothetical protein [unclassified Nostoc]MDZ7988991.1 hypothetical protein [Nostoc sp. DedVER02]MDZ8114786.1 hypothetical protein [Nostoc sp. DedVER01b]